MLGIRSSQPGARRPHHPRTRGRRERQNLRPRARHGTPLPSGAARRWRRLVERERRQRSARISARSAAKSRRCKSSNFRRRPPRSTRFGRRSRTGSSASKRRSTPRSQGNPRKARARLRGKRQERRESREEPRHADRRARASALADGKAADKRRRSAAVMLTVIVLGIALGLGMGLVIASIVSEAAACGGARARCRGRTTSRSACSSTRPTKSGRCRGAQQRGGRHAPVAERGASVLERREHRFGASCRRRRRTSRPARRSRRRAWRRPPRRSRRSRRPCSRTPGRSQKAAGSRATHARWPKGSSIVSDAVTAMKEINVVQTDRRIIRRSTRSRSRPTCSRSTPPRQTARAQRSKAAASPWWPPGAQTSRSVRRPPPGDQAPDPELGDEGQVRHRAGEPLGRRASGDRHRRGAREGRHRVGDRGRDKAIHPGISEVSGHRWIT